MPKLVDHAARREELGAALWRVVARDGVEAASLRAVATEADWSVGSLRHYFPTQAALLTFAMELVAVRVERRITALLAREREQPHGSALALALACEVLPLDDERRTEALVWLAFTTRALVDPALRHVRTRAHTRLRELCHTVIAVARGDAHGEAHDADADEEADRLHALLDGLALHALLAADHTTATRQRRIVARHLA